MQITCSSVTKCFKKSGFVLKNLPVDLDNTDLENEIIIGEQLVSMLPTQMQGEEFFFVDKTLRTEEDSTDITVYNGHQEGIELLLPLKDGHL